jgi:hypothetical protein
MNHPNESSLDRLERQIRFWRRTGVVVLAALITSWLGGIPAPRLLEAQQVRTDRPESRVRLRMECSQMNVSYTKMADALNEREAKGWEPFQFVPVYPANPGVGGPMTVSIIFRRPIK